MNSIKEYIESMPITTFKRVGTEKDWQKPNQFSKTDTMLLKNNKAIEKINKVFSATKYKFDLYFVNNTKSDFKKTGTNVTLNDIRRYNTALYKSIIDSGGFSCNYNNI